MKKMSARNFFYKKLYCVVFSLQSAALLVFFLHLCSLYVTFLHSRYKFDIVRSVWQRDAPREEDSTEFVSAVAWKPDSGVIVVANSQGIVKVLELV